MRLPNSWSKARATLGIAALTSLVWLVLSALGLDDRAAIWGGFIPARFTFAGDTAMLAPVWLTPFTSAFLHANFVHLLFNMMLLLVCGRAVEAVLGPAGIVILYLVGALAAAAAQYALDPTSAVPMIGASGAASAVIGAYAILFGRNKVKVANAKLALWLNALWLLAAWIGLQVIIGLTFAGQGVSVAFAAHIGGFIVGLALANPLLLFRYRRA